MKFFSTALAALAIGSAVAAPVVDVRTEEHASAPCDCDETVPTLPPVTLPTPCTTLTSHWGHPTGAPVPVPIHGKPDTVDISVVVETVVEVVVEVEAKVKAELALVAEIIAKADIDVDALVKVLVDLEVDLKVLLEAEACLNGLVVDVKALVAADLEVVLKLVADVQALLAEVEVCLKALVVLKADILVVIGVHLQACLGVITAIGNIVVKFALGLCAELTIRIDLHDIVVKISACVSLITNTCSGITGLLAPVFKLLL